MEIISFLQNKIAQAYTEQVWTVTFMLAFLGFMITKGETLAKNIKPKHLKLGIWVFSSIGILFIISRHLIYKHYNGYLEQLLVKSGHKLLFKFTLIERIGQTGAEYSGVIIYSMIIIILASVAHLALKNEKGRNSLKVVSLNKEQLSEKNL